METAEIRQNKTRNINLEIVFQNNTSSEYSRIVQTKPHKKYTTLQRHKTIIIIMLNLKLINCQFNSQNTISHAQCF